MYKMSINYQTLKKNNTNESGLKMLSTFDAFVNKMQRSSPQVTSILEDKHISKGLLLLLIPPPIPSLASPPPPFLSLARKSFYIFQKFNTAKIKQ